MKGENFLSLDRRDKKPQNTQGQVEWMKEIKYARIDGRDGRLEILKVSWKG